MLQSDSQLEKDDLTYVVLTPQTIADFPKSLALNSPKYKLVLPDNLFTSKRFNSFNVNIAEKLNQLFEEVIKENHIDFINVGTFESYSNNWWEKENQTDKMYLVLIKNLLNKGGKILVVGSENECTNYQNLMKFSLSANVKLITTKTFRKNLNNSECNSIPKIFELAKDFEKEYDFQNSRILIIVLSILSVPFFMYLAFVKRDETITYLSQLNPLITFLFVAFVGLFIYWYRAKYRLYYGIIETFFGILISTHVFYFNSESPKLLTTVFYIQLLSGIYVVVRGLDNIEKGLELSHFEFVKTIWKKLFESYIPKF